MELEGASRVAIWQDASAVDMLADDDKHFQELTPENLADSTWHTIVHELAHQHERNHKNE
jgi:hypothetical protein